MLIGCNYWASHAGVRMWRDWDASVVRQDLEVLAAHGVNTLRVFPTWDDFQPVTEYFGVYGFHAQYRMQDGTLPQNAEFLDETQLAHFDAFCDLCDTYGIRLIVGLLTGWMSGRLFVPQALVRRNLHSDPTALLFQQRFVRGFVRRFRDRDTVYAWDLGNECNCMSETLSREAAANWTATIANAIRAQDPARPIISGLHSLTPDGPWAIRDQGEFTDILTTHPYPVFVPHCRKDPILSQRTLLHATCETLYYADLSGKPCLVEELGTLGPNTASDQAAADFLRVNLFSGWANGTPGVLWWCANDQNRLNEPPYSWMMCERELGMLDDRLRPKPVLQEMKNFADFLQQTPISLPPARRDGVCISSLDQDAWGVAYMSYILARQAGVNLSFCAADGTLPESPVYLLPSVAGMRVLPKETYDALLARVAAGATLYLSNDTAYLTEFEAVTGLKILDSCESAGEAACEAFPIRRSRTLYLQATAAEVLLAEQDGNPLFTVHPYGQGKVYYLNGPLERMMLEEQDVCNRPYHTLYNQVFGTLSNPALGVTHHGAYTVVINYTGTAQTYAGEPEAKTVYGSRAVPPFACCILKA